MKVIKIIKNLFVISYLILLKKITAQNRLITLDKIKPGVRYNESKLMELMKLNETFSCNVASKEFEGQTMFLLVCIALSVKKH